MKKLFFISFVVLIISSCGNRGKSEADENAKDNGEVNRVEFASLTENPGNYIGKAISVEGTVVHVCTQSGKKLFITGGNPDIRLYVQAGENMPKFPMELLGSEIVVEGTLIRIDASQTGDGEGLHSGESMNAGHYSLAGEAADTCETERAMAAQPVLSDLMMVYDKHKLVD